MTSNQDSGFGSNGKVDREQCTIAIACAQTDGAAAAPAQSQKQMAVPNLEPLTIGVKTFCEVTGCKKTSAYRAIAEGQVESALIMGRRLISWGSAKAFIAREMAKGQTND